MVLGGAAGLGGAATYDAVNEPAAATSPTSLDVPASNTSDTSAEPGSVQAVAQNALPSVVKIDVVATGSAGSGGSGSGIILSRDGIILTNNHVVEAAEGGELAVSFNDGSTAEADVLGTDPVTDLAVIQAQDVSGLKPAALGSSDDVKVGQQVVAVGSPFGLESTVTSGIVSALDRPVSASSGGGDQATTFPAIQTDAAINPGNSGGPLVNMKGEVVGINTAIRGNQSLSGQSGSIGLGFATPIDLARPVAQQLIDGEEVAHAQIGVTVGPTADELGLPGGAEVREVKDGSAADSAGLQSGDVITKIDNHVVTSHSDLVAMVRTYQPGDNVKLTVVRDGDTQEISLQLGSDR